MTKATAKSTSWEQFDDASYTRTRRELLRTKGSPLQREFLGTLKSNAEFLDWAGQRVEVVPGEALALAADPLTEAEFARPPCSTEADLFAAWGDVKPAEACRAPFWGLVTMRHIAAGRVAASYLCAREGAGKTGAEQVQAVLREGGAKQIDSAVRTALRRLSGLPEARGNRSVYVNCPFARAWWRQYLAREICRESGAQPASVMRVLRSSQEYWEKLISFVVSRNSVVGDSRLRSALVAALAEVAETDHGARALKGTELKRVVRALGIRLAWQELAVFGTDELQSLIRRWFLPLFAASAAPGSGRGQSPGAARNAGV